MNTDQLNRILAPGFRTSEFWLSALFIVSDLTRSMAEEKAPVVASVALALYGASRILLKLKGASALTKAEQISGAIGGVVGAVRESRQPMAQARRLPNEYQPIPPMRQTDPAGYPVENMEDVRAEIWKPQTL